MFMQYAALFVNDPTTAVTSERIDAEKCTGDVKRPAKTARTDKTHEDAAANPSAFPARNPDEAGCFSVTERAAEILDDTLDGMKHFLREEYKTRVKDMMKCEQDNLSQLTDELLADRERALAELECSNHEQKLSIELREVKLANAEGRRATSSTRIASSCS